eukprot:Tamp_04265.p1 GENE.Tamp_04265~~Tamp_04265.p1  ORF type:complete len:575 (-),score=81.43 Tamp_04265:1524-3248(-)
MNRNQYRLPVRGTGVGSQYSMADSVRDDRLSGDGDAITAALPKATYDAGDRMTLDARGTASTWGDADRMTSADRMTTASSYARGTGYSRMGDRMTAISDQADVAPSLMPIPTGGMPRNDVGDDWEEQQRRWAGGRAPVAAGPKSVEDFSEIEEAAAGVQADRYGYAGARSTRGGVPAPNSAGGNFPTGPAAVPHDGSRDSTSSAGSRASCSGVQGGRRKPGQAPSVLPASLSDVIKHAPPEAVHGSGEEQVAARNSVQGVVDDALAGRRFLNPAMRLQAIPEAQGGRGGGGSVRGHAAPAFAGDPRGSQNGGRDSGVPGGQVQAPAQRSQAADPFGTSDYVRIDWEKFPELSGHWSEQYEVLDELLVRLDANPQAGLNQALLQKRKKAAGPNKVVVTSEGFKEFPQFKDIPAEAVALRDGRLKQILAQDLVPGDVVELKAGQRVPADCRILEASADLRVEMSAIGFRSSDGDGPGHARNNLQVDDTVGPWESKNLVFIGCMCERGRATAVVIKTGMDTALGIIAREMGWAQPIDPKPLHSRLGAFEEAFDAQTARVARSMRLTTDDGRCVCTVM